LPARGNSAVTESDKLFAGSITQVYDRFLVPLIFESYALGLARRLKRSHADSEMAPFDGRIRAYAITARS
jgi:hypothetical protein